MKISNSLRNALYAIAATLLSAASNYVGNVASRVVGPDTKVQLQESKTVIPVVPLSAVPNEPVR